MLQYSKTQANNGQGVASDALSGAEALHLLVSFFRRQFPIILVVTFLSTALGLIYITTARPIFRADAQLLIDTHQVQVFSQQPFIPTDTTEVESQVEVLKSESIASAVIEKLNLTEDPDFVAPGMREAILSFVSRAFGSAHEAPSEYVLFRRAMNAYKSGLTVVRIPKSYIIEISFRSYSAERADQIAHAIVDAYITDQLEAKYKATRQAGSWLQDRIKELREQVNDAERAVVEFKAQHNIVTMGGTARPLLNQQQVAELSSQLTLARANVADARARLDRINSVIKIDSSDKGSLPDPSFGATVTDTLKNEIVTRLWGQYLDLAALEANWSTRYGPDHLAVVNLRNRMHEIRLSIFQELKRLAETFKSDYEIAKQREVGLQKELSLAVSHSQATDANSIALTQLESTAQASKTIYNNFLQRYMEGVQQESFPVTKTRLISSPSRPVQTSGPRALVVLGIAWLGGLMLGCGIGILRDLSDRVFRSSEQVESILHANCIALAPLAGPETQNSDVGPIPNATRAEIKITAFVKSLLADNNRPKSTEALPSRSGQDTAFAASAASHANHGENSPSESTGGPLSCSDQDTTQAAAAAGIDSAAKPRSRSKTITRDGRLLWTVVDAPLSRFSEAIRSIKHANDFNGAFKANRVVGCTSCLPNEGKSTIAFSLAQLMARVSTRTILLDCDLRNPSLSRALAPRARRGLLDVLANKVEFEKAIWKDPSTNLVFLPVVLKYQFANSNEIVSSVPMKKLFEKLRESYDYIVVDLPPLAPIVDARAAAPLIDSFVFVIEWGRTKIDVVEHALGHAEEVYDNLLGVVLNKVDMTTFGRYAGHQKSYYYNNKYTRYGYTD